MFPQQGSWGYAPSKALGEGPSHLFSSCDPGTSGLWPCTSTSASIPLCVSVSRFPLFVTHPSHWVMTSS